MQPTSLISSTTAGMAPAKAQPSTAPNPSNGSEFTHGTGNVKKGNREDSVTISAEGKAAAEKDSSTSSTSLSLTQQELSELRELKSRDTEVRAHEQAHLAAAGQYARGGASFSYRKGPDGRAYAVAGEVPIDLSVEENASATISKMQTVKRAALAPANPSGADRQIASLATAKEAQARQKLMEETAADINQQEASSARPNEPPDSTTPPETETPSKATDNSLTMKQLSIYAKMANP